MSDLLGSLITPQVEMVGRFFLFFLILLYILSIVWVVRDSYLRGTFPWLWGIVALVPIVGLIAYMILRPTSYSVDRQEQELDMALRERELEQYGNCPRCGTSVRSDFIVCPNCDTQLRNVCSSCHRPLEPSWNVCPYCRTPVNR